MDDPRRPKIPGEAPLTKKDLAEINIEDKITRLFCFSEKEVSLAAQLVCITDIATLDKILNVAYAANMKTNNLPSPVSVDVQNCADLAAEDAGLRRENQDDLMICSRCVSHYHLDDPEQEGCCHFHPGQVYANLVHMELTAGMPKGIFVSSDGVRRSRKKFNAALDTSTKRLMYPNRFIWSCCRQRILSPGCTLTNTHTQSIVDLDPAVKPLRGMAYPRGYLASPDPNAKLAWRDDPDKPEDWLALREKAKRYDSMIQQERSRMASSLEVQLQFPSTSAAPAVKRTEDDDDEYDTPTPKASPRQIARHMQELEDKFSLSDISKNLEAQINETNARLKAHGHSPVMSFTGTPNVSSGGARANKAIDMASSASSNASDSQVSSSASRPRAMGDVPVNTVHIRSSPKTKPSIEKFHGPTFQRKTEK